MSEPDNFFERWSRKKLDPKDEEAGAKQETAALPPEAVEADSAASEDEGAPAKKAKPGGEEPAFDLSKLPSIDSITATTDIRMFMLPGVPMALKQAALRKVWVTDPKIRDFIEMAENQWDFTVNSPGFDFSAPVGDLKKMVADIMGKSEEEKLAEKKLAEDELSAAADGSDPAGTEVASPPPLPVTPSAENSVRLTGSSPEQSTDEIASEEVSSDEKNESENIAMQKNSASQNTGTEIPKRRHGSALPG